MNPSEWDCFKPDAAYYAQKLWEFETITKPDKGCVFVDLPLRYVLGWIDLFNEADRQKTRPDRETLMMALEEVLSTNPERDTEGHDLPLPAIWDAVTYIESLTGTIERLKQDNDTIKARCGRLNSENTELRTRMENANKMNEIKNKKISALYDEISLYREQRRIGEAELAGTTGENAPENCVKQA